MKKILGLAVGAAFLASGCVKSYDGTNNCQNVDPSLEETQILSFCGTNHINYTKDSNGIFYEIIDTGTGSYPTPDSTISVTYHATFLNGAFLDSTTGTPFTAPLSNLIEGWQLAVPYIKEGGHIKMVIPSAYCYGCLGRAPTIPPNAILYFDLELVDVK